MWLAHLLLACLLTYDCLESLFLCFLVHSHHVGSLVYKHVASACRLACLQTRGQVHVGSLFYKHLGRCMLARLFPNMWAGACTFAYLRNGGGGNLGSVFLGQSLADGRMTLTHLLICSSVRVSTTLTSCPTRSQGDVASVCGTSQQQPHSSALATRRLEL